MKRAWGKPWRLWRLGFRTAFLFGTASFNPRPHLSFEQMGRLASALRDLGFAFSAGREWSPAEVVLDLRDHGLVEGPFVEIYWTGRGWETRGL